MINEKNTERLKLIFPTAQYDGAWAQYVNALQESDRKVIPGNLAAENYETFLTNIINFKNGVLLKEGYVPSVLMFLVDSENPDLILGAIDLRLKNNDSVLHKVGHIGVSTNPTVRCKGLGKRIVRMGLDILAENGLKQIVYICDCSNTASKALAESFCPITCEEFVLDGKKKYRFVISTDR